MELEAVRTIEKLGLAPHPEGGFYRELYRSSQTVLAEDGRRRSALTVIYYLLASESYSAWHRLASDETWHFARGDELVLDLIDASGRHERLPLRAAGPWQATIPAGTAFAAHVVAGFALVTCCVAPGFAFENFALVDARELANRFPQHRETIARYTPPDDG